ncbi:MAG: LapA family protein [Elusimicrobia bacterium]|nr:LapA family protein [Elusimicrobiota bacterium]
MAQVKLILALALALVIVLFATQNPMPVEIRFLRWQTPPLPLVFVILGSALAGALVAVIAGVWTRWRSRRPSAMQSVEQDRTVNDS